MHLTTPFTFRVRSAGLVHLPALNLRLDGCLVYELWNDGNLAGRLYSAQGHTVVDMPDGTYRSVKRFRFPFSAPTVLASTFNGYEVATLLVADGRLRRGIIELATGVRFLFSERHPVSDRRARRWNEPFVFTLTDGNEVITYEGRFNPDAEYGDPAGFSGEVFPAVIASPLPVVAAFYFIDKRLHWLKPD